MVDERADAALWLEAGTGTAGSFGVLFDRYRTRVFDEAYARLASVDDAEDVVAVVFLEAWRDRARVRFVDGSLLPWLLGITSRVLRHRDRSTRRWRRLLAALPAPEQHADDGGARRERTDAIRDALLDHVRTARERRRRTLRRRVAVWGGVGLIVVGGTATAAAAIVQAQRVTNADIVYCLASPHRGADGEFRYAAATLYRGSGDAVTMSDPVSVCRDMWRRGALDSTTDQLAVDPGTHAVPARLQVCVMDDGSPAVVPGRPGVCQTAGLAPKR